MVGNGGLYFLVGSSCLFKNGHQCASLDVCEDQTGLFGVVMVMVVMAIVVVGDVVDGDVVVGDVVVGKVVGRNDRIVVVYAVVVNVVVYVVVVAGYSTSVFTALFLSVVRGHFANHAKGGESLVLRLLQPLPHAAEGLAS